MSFEVNDEVLKIDDDEYYEINVDLMLVYGRDSAKAIVQYLPADKREIIVNVEDMGALRSFMQFTKEALIKIGKDQILTLSLPRHEYFAEIASWFNDEALRIKSR